MLLAILSLFFGLLTFAGANLPIFRLLAILHLSALGFIVNLLVQFSSILGFALGVYGLVRERMTLERREAVETMCLIGIIANATPFIIAKFLRF